MAIDVVTDVEAVLRAAAGGHTKVPNNWVSATALRPLLQGDPCLVWLKHHGTAHGFEQDPKEYSFLEFIGSRGHAFEAAWVQKVAPEAVQALEDDRDVCHVEAFTRTLELMAQGHPVITKAALWWAPARMYGTADVLVLASWLFARFPHLAPADADKQPDHYLVLDCKFIAALESPDKKKDHLLCATQVRTYSHIVGHLQRHMPEHAYLVARDRVFDPLPVPVEMQLGEPLDPDIAARRDEYLAIKHDGADWLPWSDARTAPNWANNQDEPWHRAKKQIRERVPGRPLALLPRVGKKQAEALEALGYSCLDDLLAVDPATVDLESLPGVGSTIANRIRAVLRANRTGRPSRVPGELVPARPDKGAELFVDFEFFSSVHCDFEKEWPHLPGLEMVFLIGAGWEDAAEGTWRYRQFLAPSEDLAGERQMFDEFLRFLKEHGIFDPRRHGGTLYHWSGAELTQARRAAERHHLPILDALPWTDLQAPFHGAPLGVPGAWGYGIKEVAQALGRCSPEHGVTWPDGLAEGLSAMVMGWRMYESPDPARSPEMAVLSAYLEADVRALWQVLRWLRANGSRQAEQQAQQCKAASSMVLPPLLRRWYGGLPEGNPVPPVTGAAAAAATARWYTARRSE